MEVTIGLIGDYDAKVPAHQAIPLALALASEAVGIGVRIEWIPTEEITSAARVEKFDGLWCVPASPYRSMEGALIGIQHARVAGVPFLGTCGGFQHAVVEYARNVVGWANADHGETSPTAAWQVITLLECPLVEVAAPIRLLPGTHLATAYGSDEVIEGYHCRFGFNPEFRAALTAGLLRPAAEDRNGEVRGVELQGHPFFVATLFQPERAALQNRPVPIVNAFVRACSCAKTEPVVV